MAELDTNAGLVSALITTQLRFNGLRNTEELCDTIKEMFSFTSSVVLENVKGNINQFKASLSAAFFSETEVEDFVLQYCKHNDETIKVSMSRKIDPKSPYSFLRRYRCQHNTKYAGTKNAIKLLKENPSRRTKNTECPFSMIIKVMKQRKALPCQIVIEWSHNHPLNTLQVNSFKDNLSCTADKVMELFQKGFTPGLAYRQFNDNLRFTCKDELEFHLIKSDRSISPRRPDFNRLYSEFCKEKYGSKNGKEMFDHLDEKIASYKDLFPRPFALFHGGTLTVNHLVELART